eukprot:scaffold140_cov565-Prasinococcus_capsulatus_cf.AAC.28
MSYPSRRDHGWTHLVEEDQADDAKGGGAKDGCRPRVLEGGDLLERGHEQQHNKDPLGLAERAAGKQLHEVLLQVDDAHDRC